MYVIRDVFKCKPGHSRSVAEKFKNALVLTRKIRGVSNGRVLIDYVGAYWTVVLESEVENLAQFEKEMIEYGADKQMQKAVKGYMDEIEGGHREIFRIA